MTGNAALMTLYPCPAIRESVIGIQPSGGCTPLRLPSQFSQYPCSTLPAGRDLTAQVLPPVGVGEGDVVRDGDGDGLVVVRDGDGDGLVVVRDGEGEAGVVPPVQAPRSVHSAGTAAGVQPAPTGGVFACRAWYAWPW
jgi:hypothetical protein